MSTEPLANIVEIDGKKEDPREKDERDLYRLIRDSMELVGGIGNTAKIMGVDRGDLSRALDRSGRYIAIEHVRRFGERLVQYSPETAQRIGAALVRPFDLVVFPRVQLTAAERARRYENLLRVMGQAMGVDLVNKALETP
jgi:hypothetical protein